MEQIKKEDKRPKKSSLRKSFIFAVLYTVMLVVILSGVTIWGCLKLQKWLLPDSNEVNLNVTKTYDDGTETKMSMIMGFGKETEQEAETKKEQSEKDGEKAADGEKSKQEKSDKPEVRLVENQSGEFSVVFEIGSGGKTASDKKQPEEPNEKNIRYSVDKVENSYEALTPKRKMAYTGASVAMVGLPLLYSVTGILICGFWFYKRKLKKPIKILADATENIARQDLDFSVKYHSGDEMGMLCASFEKMRQALYENNRELWRMLEERKMLQASVAHDLRNPIAIIEGYAQYLQLNLPKGRLKEKELMNIVGNLSDSAKRLEAYTDSMRDISHLEELEIKPADLDLQPVLQEMTDDFFMIAKKNHIRLHVFNHVLSCRAKIDAQILYRILENVFLNAIRFAKETVSLEYFLEEPFLTVKVQDDGSGFPDSVLKGKNRYVPSMNQSDGHMGMGLVISNILCKKHGGELKIENEKNGGASVTIKIKMKSN